MTDYIEMRLRKGGEVVRVYNIGVSAEGKGSFATVWRPSISNFETLKMNSLVPMDCSFTNGDVTSKTEKNKLKDLLILSYSEWTCTDGTIFKNCDEAIEYQKTLV